MTEDGGQTSWNIEYRTPTDSIGTGKEYRMLKEERGWRTSIYGFTPAAFCKGGKNPKTRLSLSRYDIPGHFLYYFHRFRADSIRRSTERDNVLANDVTLAEIINSVKD